jgi:hypothetical protein
LGQHLAERLRRVVEASHFIGDEAEYHCDTDYVDDNWVPRAWDWKFGSLLWAHKTPSFFDTTSENWDMTFDPQGRSLEPFRRNPAAAKDAKAK